ncbi:hypothetical protein PVAND_015264 [Polypedilum vanderplanki]|uniref:ZAD domain-containing protein n=1 Tax=Polypedilum vanderplanki TaxID=319348 RepID=A0A9J6BCI0_POLVA|nr:hypothetical protein PVAND_015264 [Polypedilum vanderplanki]
MTELCRLCGDFKLIGSSGSSLLTIDDPTIKQHLETNLKIILDPDKLLPHLVCASCSEMLEKCVKFTNRIVEVQERLKNELLEQLNDFPCDDFQNFELKIERLDVNEEKIIPKKPARKSQSSKRNRGLKMTREVVKYTMENLFSNELSGKFTAEIEQMPIGLTENLGWFNFEWKCNNCNEIFSNVIDLEKHSIKCTKKRCINHCQNCSKDFPSYSTFLNHVVEKHEQLLKFSCIICSEFKRNFIELYQHIVNEHNEHQNIFFCLYCGKL